MKVKKRMSRAVLFDLDGTLLDTSKGVVSSVKYTIKELGFMMPSEEELESFIGPPIKNKMMEMYHLTEDEALKAMNTFRTHYAVSDLFKADVYDGLEKVLKDLRKEGYHLGVATYKREDMAQSLLKKKEISKYFDVIHGADAEGKLSKADVVNLCIRDLDVENHNVIMIGDSSNDAVGAEKADTKFIGVTYGFGFKTKEDIKQYRNVGIAENCAEIATCIRNINW